MTVAVDPRLDGLPDDTIDRLTRNGWADDPHADRIALRLHAMLAAGIDEVFVNDAANLLIGKGAGIAPDGSIDTTPPPGGWADPEPTIDPLTERTRPDFPLEVFPAWVRDFVEGVADELQAPIDLPATVALGVLSLITSRRAVRVEVWEDGWSEFTNLYLVCALPPGGSKSPAFSKMFAPLNGLQATLDDAHELEWLEWRTEHEIRKGNEQALKRKAHKDSATGADVEQYRQAFAALHEHEQTEPQRERLNVGDTTPEAILDPIAANGGHIAVLSPEGTFFDAMTRYIERGKSANVDIYLVGYSGDPYDVDRVSRDRPVHIDETRITICVLTQPEVLHRHLGDDTNRSRGFSDRIMVSEPRHTIGQRRYHGHRAQVPATVAAEYADGINQMLALVADERLTLRLAEPARDYFDLWRDGIEKQRRGRWAPLEGMPEKCHQAVIRTAGILHLAHGWGPDDDIDAATIADACLMGDYWLEMALAIATETTEDDTDAAAAAVLAWATAENLESFTLRELSRAGTLRGHGRDTYEELAEVIERLADAGAVVIPSGDDHGPWWRSTRGKPSPVVERVDRAVDTCRHAQAGNASSGYTTTESRKRVGGVDVSLEVSHERENLSLCSEVTTENPETPDLGSFHEISPSTRATRPTRSSWLLGDDTEPTTGGDGT